MSHIMWIPSKARWTIPNWIWFPLHWYWWMSSWCLWNYKRQPSNLRKLEWRFWMCLSGTGIYRSNRSEIFKIMLVLDQDSSSGLVRDLEIFLRPVPVWWPVLGQAPARWIRDQPVLVRGSMIRKEPVPIALEPVLPIISVPMILVDL